MARLANRLQTAGGIWLVRGMEPVWLDFLLLLSARNQGYVTGRAGSGLLPSYQKAFQPLSDDAAVVFQKVYPPCRCTAPKAALRLLVDGLTLGMYYFACAIVSGNPVYSFGNTLFKEWFWPLIGIIGIR